MELSRNFRLQRLDLGPCRAGSFTVCREKKNRSASCESFAESHTHTINDINAFQHLKPIPKLADTPQVALLLKRNLGLEAVALFALDRGAPHIRLYSDEGYRLLCEDEPLEFFEGFNPVV